jgi:hypothetical protein
MIPNEPAAPVRNEGQKRDNHIIRHEEALAGADVLAHFVSERIIALIADSQSKLHFSQWGGGKR